MAASLVSLAILKSCTSCKSGESKYRASVLASLGDKTDDQLLERELQGLVGSGLVVELFDATKIQRREPGEKMVAKMTAAVLLEKIGLRILAEMPEFGSNQSLGSSLLTQCLEILGIPNGKKVVQELIDEGSLNRDAKDRLTITESGDQRLKKDGRPFRRTK